MNRQVAQILIGATALTGAFFFGSVMQRRHGDLEKTSSNQPMLEHEDLVWHSGPEKLPPVITVIFGTRLLEMAFTTLAPARMIPASSLWRPTMKPKTSCRNRSGVQVWLQSMMKRALLSALSS